MNGVQNDNNTQFTE